jgi:Tol biopolymer transport system component
MAGSLWRQSLNSDEAVEITHGPGYDLQPDWSPDGRWIAFVRYHADAMELWRVDAASGRQEALTSSGAVQLEPRFSPDGGRLAFVSTEGSGHFNLFAADLTNRGLGRRRALVPPRETKTPRYYYSQHDHAINPSWSRDGRRVYYVGNADVAWGSGDIWSVAADNPDDRVKILVEETTWAARPELSPEGRRLLYSSYQGRQWHQLWLTTPGGKSPLPLTFGEFDRRSARWSPDGRTILYISNQGGNTSLWLQDVATGQQRMLVTSKRAYERPMGNLVITLRDESDRPLAARLMVLAEDGRYYAPADRWLHGDDGFDRALQSQENRYFHCRERCAITVPAGRVQVWAMSGLARLPFEQEVNVPASGHPLTVTLRPHALPAVFGEFTSADLHVHMNYGGAYRQDIEGLALQAQAEDLDVVHNLIVNKEQRIPDIDEFTPRARQVGDTTVFVGQEFHTSFWGHVGLLHLDRLLLPDFSAYQHTALASPFPHNGVVSDAAHAQGATSGYVHPFDWPIVPAKEKSLAHTLPVDAALKKTDYVEVVGFSDHHATAGVWYRLLNLGLHVAAGAGTDAMTNYASLRGPVGLNRVYLATRSRTAAELSRTLREGRGFVTNGPLLGLRVEDSMPGDTLQLARGQKRVRVQAAVRSIVPLSHAELVVNGRVVRRLRLDRDGRALDFSGHLEIPASGWLLLRAYNETPQVLVQDLYPYGTTNPVWIDNGTPAPRASADAQYFVEWIDRVIEAAGARTDYNSDAEREQTLEYLRAGRAFYERK